MKTIHKGLAVKGVGRSQPMGFKFHIWINFIKHPKVSDTAQQSSSIHAYPVRKAIQSLVTTNIKKLVANFSSATFHRVRRSLDEAAHILARTYDRFFFFFAPDCIRNTLCIDII